MDKIQILFNLINIKYLIEYRSHYKKTKKSTLYALATQIEYFKLHLYDSF